MQERLIMNDTTQPLVIELWPGVDTGSESGVPQEVEYLNPNVDHRRFLRNVTVPTLTAFLPDRSVNTGTAVIVCPGGGLHALAIDYEGLEIAQWLCERGIAAFVLKYRLISTPIEHDEFQAGFSAILDDLPHLLELTRQHIPTALADGQRAVDIVRQRATEWGIHHGHIGMMGFSAGAFVTVITTLQADSQSRPDFAASIYGALWERLEASAPLPPLFIALTDDDALTIEPSLHLYSTWHQANSSAEMHIYARGEHGFAMRKKNPAVEAWIERFYEWLQIQEFVKP
jgi:acetyl esterase/lipase